MTDYPSKTPRDTEIDEHDVMRLAETTEVSPQQARDLLKRHGGDFGLAQKDAREFRAES